MEACSWDVPYHRDPLPTLNAQPPITTYLTYNKRNTIKKLLLDIYAQQIKVRCII